jgi:VanZ family protein
MRFVLAIAGSALLVLSAPFVGQIRSGIRRTFPGHFVAIVGGAIALGLLVALAAAVRRIRDRRPQRYTLVLLAMAIAAAYSSVNIALNPNAAPESNVVELFHFLQYGTIAFLFYRAWQLADDVSIVVLPLLSGVIVGTVEEWFQWFIPNRVGEMKDVLLNLVALSTGLMFAVALEPPRHWRMRLTPASRRRVGIAAAATLVAFAAFFNIVHLGSRVSDGEIGTFDSRWSAERLLGIQAERRAQWRTSPPPVRLVRLSREDQYLTEGIQHVRERNKAWDAGRIEDAWLENRILEKYYEPVLDTPTHEGAAGHRWPAPQRADAESRRLSSTPSEPYVSHAYPYPIYAWRPVPFWIAIACGALGLLVAGRRGSAAPVRNAASSRTL